MPRSVARSLGAKNSASASSSSSSSINTPSVDIFRSASSRAIIKELERIDSLFYHYAEKSSNMIEPEGIQSLCSDLGVDHIDVRMLLLAWKMKAEKQGYFTQDEWRRGMKVLKADSIGSLKKALTHLKKEVWSKESFADFYSYAFRYSLTEEKQRSLDTESVCILLEIVLGPLYRCQIDCLVEFLKCQTDYRAINMDQWMCFLRFCKEVQFPNLSNYDPDQAWPLILDNFVDWKRRQH